MLQFRRRLSGAGKTHLEEKASWRWCWRTRWILHARATNARHGVRRTSFCQRLIEILHSRPETSSASLRARTCLATTRTARTSGLARTRNFSRAETPSARLAAHFGSESRLSSKDSLRTGTGGLREDAEFSTTPDRTALSMAIC